MSAPQLPRLLLVALADSDETYRVKLSQLFESEPDLKLVSEPFTVAGALSAADRLKPDVLLLAGSGDSHEALTAMERIHASKNSVKSVLLLASDNVEADNQSALVRAVRAGCRGILQKNCAPELLFKCVRKVCEGELWLDRATTSQVLQQFTAEQQPQKPKERDARNSPLSPREREIVLLVVQGFKNKELAERLAISEQTVKNHMHNIFDKVGVSDRLELALYAIHNNLLKPDSQ